MSTRFRRSVEFGTLDRNVEGKPLYMNAGGCVRVCACVVCVDTCICWVDRSHTNAVA